MLPHHPQPRRCAGQGSSAMRAPRFDVMTNALVSDQVQSSLQLCAEGERGLCRKAGLSVLF